MAKVFDIQDELHESPNRNNFDLTHKVHTSGKFGVITPFLCQPHVPTDAWEIQTAIGVNFMPMWYPTQTKMRFIVHYFDVPYRLLWKDWKNSLEGLVDEEMPYIYKPAEYFQTGSLCDHLGVPTVYTVPQDLQLGSSFAPPRVSFRAFGSKMNSFSGCKGRELSSSFPSSFDQSVASFRAASINSIGFLSSRPIVRLDEKRPTISFNSIFNFGDNVAGNHVFGNLLLFGTNSLDGSLVQLTEPISFYEFTTDSVELDSITLNALQTSVVNSVLDSGEYKYIYPMFVFSVQSYDIAPVSIRGVASSFSYYVASGTDVPIAFYPQFVPFVISPASEPTNNRLRLRAFAFRAYEMIYNAYYRNSQGNQPFVVNGQTKYNEYLPSTDGGADEYEYKLHERNWELDAYTSCLPSPQQGNAPIIGVTVDGTLSVTHDDGRTTRVSLRDLDGAAGLDVSNTSIDPDHPEDARTIMSLASSGMTIADFRSGNALTRFLETSLRTGFRYADFIFGHFGKSPSHQELDMPVFIGGYTQLVDVNKISNVTASGVEGAPALGDFAGTAQSFDAANHSVKHYFDDFGLVIGVMMLVPDAAYSQLLPKHFTYNNRLDFYFPEFSQLGLQPVTYEEVCPIQSYAEYSAGDSSKLLTDTFGYQRPNHDLVWLPDTCHGLFRTHLKDSVINRRFGYRPTLGDNFLRIKPEDCNSIFSVIQPDEDVWTGQILVNITAQRPIPRIVIPSLGR